ncbi:dTMP kinase, partial [Patescibacteria group bacterium]
MKKGKFITIYGINNIGKTTQSKLLVENLEQAGYDVIYVKYPVYSIEPSGPFINKILRNSNNQSISEEELQSWFVLNRYQYQPKLIQFLNEGKIIVAEDYSGTGIAWGTAKGVNQSWLESINNNLLKEDLAIMLEGQR